MEGEQPESDDTFQTYLEYRAELVDRHAESARTFDKALGTLAGGALVLSIAFIRDVVPEPEWLCLLVASWVSLAGSLAANLLSFFFAERDYHRSVALLDDDYEKGRFPHDPLTASGFEGWVTGMNLSGLVLFALGLVFIVGFAVANL